MVKEFLSERQVAYTLKNVSLDPQALEEFRQAGYLLPPITVIDGEAVAGFDPQRLQALLFSDFNTSPLKFHEGGMMYLHHEVYNVNPGWQRELEGRVPRLHEMQSKAPGFVAAHLLRYMGDLTTYLALRVWESREAAQGFSRTPEFQEYLRSRPPDAYARPPEIEYYELVCEEQGSGRASVAYHLELDLAGGQARAWEERERELHVLFKGAPGFHSARAFRFLGNPNHHLRVALWESREAILDFTETSAFRAHQAAAPAGLLRSPATLQFYQVVQGVAKQ